MVLALPLTPLCWWTEEWASRVTHSIHMAGCATCLYKTGLNLIPGRPRRAVRVPRSYYRRNKLKGLSNGMAYFSWTTLFSCVQIRLFYWPTSVLMVENKPEATSSGECLRVLRRSGGLRTNFYVRCNKWSEGRNKQNTCSVLKNNQRE